MGMDGFSLYASIDEMNRLLSGGRIDKIAQPRKSDIYISVRLPGMTHVLHVSIDPAMPTMTVTKRQIENPPEPPVFCMLLRKQLEGGRIAQIYQLGRDRAAIVEIDTLGAGGLIVTKKLYIELMGKYSNIILTQDDIVIDSLRRVGTNSSRVRTILPQQPYMPPPQQDSIDVLEHQDEFIATVKGKIGEDIYRAVLHTGAGFGPITAKQILFLAGLPKDMPVESLEESDYVSLSNALQELLDIYEKKEFTPTLIKNKNNKVVAMAAFALDIYPNDESMTFTTMSEMLEMGHKLTDDYVSPEKEHLLKFVVHEINKQNGKKNKLLEELSKSQQAEDEKIKADNIMTYQYRFIDHIDSEIKVNNIYADDGAEIIIPMDKKLTVVQNMQKYYQKYDKLRRAEKILAAQINDSSENIKYLGTIEAALFSSVSISELADIKNELIAGGYMQMEKRKRMAIAPSKPFKFILSDGTEVLVGKNNYQNDKITLKTAQSSDIWLHTKDIPGSHVIIRTQGLEPDDTVIEEAASLAAYFSKAKDSSNVPVDYTKCRFVKKPAGAKPGFVIFTNNKTLYITPDKEKMAKLLKQNNIE